MRRSILLVLALGLWMVGAPALADGPAGSHECHLQDDDCDRTIDEDTGTAATDNQDGDALFDEDSPGDTNGDGNDDDDLDGLIDEDPADDDGDGAINEDPPGDALDDAGENQVTCGDGEQVGPVGNVYAGDNGAEVCADEDSELPIDGRVVVSLEEGYVAIDGDNDNTQGPSNGYARADADGVHCGDENNQDSGADQSNNDQSDCG